MWLRIMVTWEEPDNFVSGEYVVIKAVIGGNSYYTCAILMEDPQYDLDCLCRSLETNNEFRVHIDSNIMMSELV